MNSTTYARRRFMGSLAVGAALAALPLGVRRAAAAQLTLDEVNRMSREQFVENFGNTFELAPWVAQAAYSKRPFATVNALFLALYNALRSAPVPEQVAFLAKFSHLSDNAPPAGTITDASKSEKGSVGLETMPPAAIARLADSIKAYKAKFGYTYTICVRRHTAAFIHSELERRLRNDAAQELEVTMKEVADIARLRVVEQVKGPGAPTVYGELSTHVMDAIAGRPAVGMRIELFEPRADKLFRVAQGEMNETGRINLMEKRPVPIGRYELRFAVADYFKRRGVGGNSPPYIDYVPVRFAINDAEGRYHIPLICSPSSFAVYRGS